MRAIAVPMILLMLSASLAGCTGGDPDGNDESSIDMDILNQMIDDNLQDFINNTSVTVNNHYYTNESSTEYNSINGSSSSTTYHFMAGTDEGFSSTDVISNRSELVLLVRNDQFSASASGNSASGLHGAHICVGIGTTEEGTAQQWFSSRNIAFTSVPVADAAEATAKFISAECDAMIGSRDMITAKKIQLDNDGTVGSDIWITNAIGNLGDVFAVESRIELTLNQDFGKSLNLEDSFLEIELTATCVTNCTSEDTESRKKFRFDISENVGYNFHQSPSQFQWNSLTDWEIEYICIIEGYGPFASNNWMPGLECELTIFAHAFEWANNPNYEYTWSDWAYHVQWAETEMIFEE